MPNYEVIVGNIGSVQATRNKAEAEKTFDEYVDQSKNLPGARCYGEDVTIMKDGEPYKEHIGTYHTDDLPADNTDTDSLNALELLEELLSLTEPYKPNMDPGDLRRWSAISARTADIRAGAENDD